MKNPGFGAFMGKLEATSRAPAMHPVEVEGRPCRVRPEGVRVFSPGKDSTNPDEFWLEMWDAPGFAAQVDLRHFTSPALTAWLARRRSPRLLGHSPTRHTVGVNPGGGARR